MKHSCIKFMRNELFFKSVLISVIFQLSTSCSEGIDQDTSRRFFEVSVDEVTASPECAEMMSVLQPYLDAPGFFMKLIEVPLDWEDRNGNKKIRLFVYGFDSEANSASPIIFLNGGPLGSSHSSFKALVSGINKYNLDVVFFDQRGTGCSTNLPEYESLDSIHDMKFFRTLEIAYDIDAIRQVLWNREQKIKLWAQSYGGFLAFRYLSIFGQYLSSIHVHGYTLMDDHVQWYINRFYSQKYVFEKFFEMYPLAHVAYLKLKSKVDQNTCYKTQYGLECGSKFLQSATAIIGQFESWERISERFQELLHANGEINIEAIEAELLSNLVDKLLKRRVFFLHLQI